MKFENGIYELDIDVERTKAYYHTTEISDCDCAQCRNYRLAITQLAEPVKEFLGRFGVDPSKPFDMTIYQKPEGGRVCYDGFFYIWGDILKGRDPLQETDSGQLLLKPEYRIRVDEESSAYFAEDFIFAEDDDNAIQLNISFMLPWLLDEPEPNS